MKQSTKHQFLLTVSFLLISYFSFAQGLKISGTIADEIDVLPGASVYLKGTTLGTTTDFSGEFNFYTTTTGKQTLIISYIGYKTKEIVITLKDGENLNLGTIKILGTENALDEIIVKGNYFPTQVKALNMKKKSLAITEVIAADAIGKLPDRNAAEAVQRMQGVSIERDMGEGRRVIVRGAPTHWTSTVLNGNRLPSAGGASDERYTQLDVFPTELIQYVQLSKALTPDIDGDAIGGSMNFITKSSPNKQTISATVAGGYNTRADDPSYNASFVYGDRINDKFGFIASAVIWDRRAGINQYRVDYDFSNTDAQQAYGINTLQLRDYLARRVTTGYNLAMDYKITPNSKIYFKGLYSNYLDQQNVRETYFNFHQNNVQYQARHADYVTDLYSLKLGGEFNLTDRLSLDAAIQTASSKFKLDSPDNLPESERGYPIVNFVQSMTYGGRASDGLVYMLQDSPNNVGSKIDNILPNNETALDPSKARLNQILLSILDKKETDYTGNLDFTYNANNKLDLKFGGKLAHKKRDYNSSLVVKLQSALLGIPDSAPILYLSDLERENTPYDGSFLNELGNTYNNVKIESITNNQIDKMYTDEFASQHGLLTVLTKDAPSNAPSSYTAKEKVYSSYVMGNYKLSDKLELIGGIRNESNHLEFIGSKVSTDANGATVEEIKETKKYNAFLPMLHAKINLSEKAILRTAYTRTYARPTFNRLNPGTQISEIALTITEGNTALNPTFSNNFDAMFEFYPEGLGLLSAGAYYKSLTDYIYDDQSIVNLNGQNYIRSRPENLDNAWLYGIELGLVKRFDKMDNFLKNIGVELNYSYINSEVEIPTYTNGVQTGSYKTTLPGQAKHIGNVILFYENNKFLARIAGNLKGKYVSSIRSAAGPDHYQWFDDNFTVDFSSSYSINDRLRVFAEISNITNAQNRYYHGNSDRPEIAGWSGIRGQIGLSFNIR
ncbi:TonB-dependent receptor [Polaribacter sargassicola]|uniref:TonB-dependent receptor n=1 Tax=Polaribacter sargassicola TaxID=2836891 RepID=UPI001F005DE9|nr:TonB-dependent receptor [Polaribacter sp. DS7-9]MCG1035039.1 TonB-dependent receptor [Polaribacter sp. DS7-9]